MTMMNGRTYLQSEGDVQGSTHGLSCFDVLEFDEVLVDKFMMEGDDRVTFLLKAKNSEVTVVFCMYYDELRKSDSLFYECTDRNIWAYLEDPRKTMYLKVKGMTKTGVAMNFLVDNRSILDLLERGVKYVKVQYERTLPKTVSRQALIEVDFVSANHCQEGTNEDVYKVVEYSTELNAGGWENAHNDDNAQNDDNPQHDQEVLDAVSVESKYVMFLFSDGTIEVHPVDPQFVISSKQYPPENLTDGSERVVAIASGETYNVAVLFDGRIVLWGENEHYFPNVPERLHNPVRSIRIEHNVLAIVTTDNSVYQYTKPGYESLKFKFPANIQGHTISVEITTYFEVALLTNNTVVSSSPNQPRVLQLKQGQVKFVSTGGITDPLFIVCYLDGSVEVWDVHKMQYVKVFDGSEGQVISVHATATMYAVLLESGLVKLWDKYAKSIDGPSELIGRRVVRLSTTHWHDRFIAVFDTQVCLWWSGKKRQMFGAAL